MTAPIPIRILHDPPLDGRTNMARDEALMHRVGRGASPPTLRLYQWEPPTISLGYFQHYADYQSLPAPAGGLAVVRRPTGGGAILHDLELTYSLILPIHHPLLAGGPNRLYELAHDAVIAALAALGIETNRCGHTDDSGAARGPFFCFARRHCYDVLLGPDKIAGSAQRRTRHAVLQHGSIVLGNRFDQQPTAVIFVEQPPAPAHREFSETVRRLRGLFVSEFARVTGAVTTSGQWSAEELSDAEPLIIKYDSPDWTRRA